MAILKFIFTYFSKFLLLACPFFAAVIAQTIKTFLVRKNRMNFKDLVKFSYSGMPSGHSAFVTSLLTIIALTQGLDSPIFAFALVFAMIVISDALKFRRYLGQHGTAFNTLVEDLKTDQFLNEDYPILKEKIGHTKAEVLVGSLIGIVIGIAFFLLANSAFLLKYLN